jgi:hypothetical protein
MVYVVAEYDIANRKIEKILGITPNEVDNLFTNKSDETHMHFQTLSDTLGKVKGGRKYTKQNKKKRKRRKRTQRKRKGINK